MSDLDKDKTEIFEDEKKILLDHDYDGIRELNHPLPGWWLTIFYGTIVFAIAYYVAYTFMGATTIDQALEEDMKEITAIQEEYEAKQGKFNQAEYEAVIADAGMLKKARKVYKRKCKACHGADGGGGVGPNLADKNWINGNGSLETTYNVINKGVVDKGMAAWGPVIGKEMVYAVLKYVHDFQGTTPTNPKAPQGELYE